MPYTNALLQMLHIYIHNVTRKNKKRINLKINEEEKQFKMFGAYQLLYELTLLHMEKYLLFQENSLKSKKVKIIVENCCFAAFKVSVA